MFVFEKELIVGRLQTVEQQSTVWHDSKQRGAPIVAHGAVRRIFGE